MQLIMHGSSIKLGSNAWFVHNLPFSLSFVRSASNLLTVSHILSTSARSRPIFNHLEPEDFASFLKTSIHVMPSSRKKRLPALETVEGAQSPEMLALRARWTIWPVSNVCWNTTESNFRALIAELAQLDMLEWYLLPGWGESDECHRGIGGHSRRKHRTK
jgi:hypothetical protein